jgi:hypothetical protein
MSNGQRPTRPSPNIALNSRYCSSVLFGEVVSGIEGFGVAEAIGSVGEAPGGAIGGVTVSFGIC